MFSNLRKQDFWPSRGTFFIGIGIAICLAALVSLLVQTTRILEAQKTEALVMDVAGYQRTLHQKHLTEMLLASQGIPSDYFATRKAIQSNLHALMHGGMVLINLRTGKTDQIPQAPTDTILAKLQEQEAFLREVVEISNQGLPPSTNQGLDSSPMFQTLLNHNDQLLRIADEAVKLFNRHFESKMTSMITLEWAMGIFVAFLVILLTSLWIRTYRKLNHEIIERQRAEADNQENKIFLTSIVENLPNMLFVKSALDLRFVMFNHL